MRICSGRIKLLQRLYKSEPYKSNTSKLRIEILSVFGEILVQPKDEYIVFSEFPLGNKRVDFTILQVDVL